MTHPRLRAERSPHGFRRLLLARPERHNPLDAALARALRDAFAGDRGTGGAGQHRQDGPAPNATRIGEASEPGIRLLYECLEIMITRPGR
jgi:hypothetical protein